MNMRILEGKLGGRNKQTKRSNVITRADITQCLLLRRRAVFLGESQVALGGPPRSLQSRDFPIFLASVYFLS
jgi:hypothetical protein